MLPMCAWLEELIEAIAEQAKGPDWANPSCYRLLGVDEVLDLRLSAGRSPPLPS
jgi:hypothetical protein